MEKSGLCLRRHQGRKCKLVSLLTNDTEMEAEDVAAVYRKRWAIELPFKQVKQNFSMRYFYGESANAIKTQVWVTLIAYLLLMVLQKELRRKWSFSGLATMVRITLMYYVDFNSLFNHLEKDWKPPRTLRRNLRSLTEGLGSRNKLHPSHHNYRKAIILATLGFLSDSNSLFPFLLILLWAICQLFSG